jgi:hypothetical protein
MLLISYMCCLGFLFCFVSLDSTGGWSQGLTLARQASFHLSHSISLFCVGYFWDRSSLWAWAGLDHGPPICPSHVAGMTGCTTIFRCWLRWGLANFCQGWPQNMILWISVSQEARITGLSHHTWPVCVVLRYTQFRAGIQLSGTSLAQGPGFDPQPTRK